MAVERRGGLEPRRGMALGSLVLAIGSFLALCAGPLLSIPAIIMGFTARSRASRDPREYGGGGMALTGAIVGIVNLLLTPVIWLLTLPFVMVFLAVLIPGMNKAREQAMRTTDGSSIRQIMSAVIVYTDEHGGDYPPHLAAVADKLPSMSVLVSKRSKTPVLGAVPTGKPWTDFAADVDSHCDFAYIGAGMKSGRLTDPSGTVVVFTKLLPGDPGRTVGFADGHTEWMQGPPLDFAMRHTNEYRKTVGLGEVTLDTMIPALPVTIGPPPAAKPPEPVVKQPEPPVKPPRPAERRTAKAPTPPVQVEPGTPAPPRVDPVPPPAPAIPPVPAEPDERLVTVKSVDQALTAMRTGNAATKRSALTFLERATPDEAHRKEIAAELEKCLADTHQRRSALMGLRKWSTKDNAPALAKLLTDLEPEQARHFAEINILLEALGNTGDAKAGAEPAAKMLTHGFNRTATSKALIAMGPEAEPAVIPYLSEKDSGTARVAMEVLAKIGTGKSLPELEKLLAEKNPFTRKAAEDTIKAIKEREGSK